MQFIQTDYQNINLPHSSSGVTISLSFFFSSKLWLDIVSREMNKKGIEEEIYQKRTAHLL